MDWKALEMVHPEAAGIDVGGSERGVAVRPERDAEPVRRFGCFTADRRPRAEWLVEKGVRSVAFAVDRVYWMPVLEMIEQHGLEVYLVNARHTKHVPGRKSDIQECQWLLKLHTFGLLEQQFSADGGDSGGANVVAAPGQSGGRGNQYDAADAESPYRDEYPVKQRAERPERYYGHGYRAGDYGRRTDPNGPSRPWPSRE